MGITQKIFNHLPNMTISNPRALRILNKAGDIMSRPMPNRLILGGTAILIQPYIEMKNKRVDKDTACASKNRIIGKIVAGTTVGCIVRELVFQFVNKCTNNNLDKQGLANLLFPKVSQNPAIPDNLRKGLMLNYKTAMALILGMVAMIFTNLLFDMPLTTKIANKLNENDAKKKAQKVKVPQTTNITDKFRDKFNMNKGGIS